MNVHLQNILNKIQEDKTLSEEEKNAIINSLQDANKEFEIANFKLDRTEKVKRTTAILLEETIAELEQKRKDVEDQNRELEIEAALEKVRSRSLAMHKSDELNEVILTVFEKLKQFNVVTDGVALINLYAAGTKDVVQWIANPELMTTGCFTLPYFDHPILSIIWEARESGKGFVTHTFDFEEKNSFWNYTFQHTDYKYLSDDLKKMLLESEGYGYIVAFEKYSSILVCTYTKKQFSIDAIEILKRFAKVFEQAYIRFLDLQKAETQAREAQIEAALERVRSRSLAMHKSEDLKDIVIVVLEQLQRLGFVMEGGAAHIQIFNDASKEATQWSADPLLQSAASYKIPYNDNPLFTDFLKAKNDGEDFFSHKYSFEEKNKWFDWAFEHTDFKHLPDQFKKMLMECESYAHWAAFQKNSAIVVNNVLGDSLSQDQIDILKRFSKVFEQGYIRFLDLQKAEAQAREAQIELGLERVRAKAMAMHKSDELLDAGELLYRELSKLGIVSMTCGYVLMDDEEKIGWIYASSPADGTILPKPTGIPHTNSVMASIKESWKKQEPLHVVELDAQDTIEHHTYLAKNSINFLFTLEEFLAISPERIVMHSFNFRQGYLLVVGMERLTSAQEEMLLRFTKVFEMTYRRFLDLKKAEAQARESQIEAALERVRSRTMGMQKSEELTDVAAILFKQINDLGVKTWTTGFDVWSDDNNFFTDYVTNPQGGFIEPYTVDTRVYPVFTAISDAKKRGDEFFIHYEEGEMLKETYRQLTKVGEKQFRAILESGFQFPQRQIEHFVFGSKVSLMFITYERVPEAHDIFKRFGKVFEQTYTRFLDLQKAEAQAKEAQIETALERVRSRTMGMQKSEELKEIIKVVYKQFVHLNIPVEHAGFIMDYKASDNMNIWLTDQHNVPSQITIPYFDSPHWNSFIEAKEKGKNFFANHLSFEEKNKFYQYLFKLFPVPDEAKEYYLTCPGLAISTVLLEDVGLYIENFSGTPYTDEENNTLMRFGKVFQQTYTRFLDLQKAEAQAREAQIEVAVERVRAKALAMHKSEEILQVAITLKQQMESLDLKGVTAATIYLQQDNGFIRVWDITELKEGDEGPQLSADFEFKLNDTEPGLWVRRIWNAKEKYSVIELSGDDFSKCERWLRRFDTKAADNYLQFIKAAQLKHSWHPTVQLEKGKLNIDFILPPPAEMEFILLKMGAAFDLAYRRFLDLQKAEAQAREAQIEASLERIRSASMAMHSSDELQNVIRVLTDQLSALGFQFDTANFITNDSMPDWDIWISSPGFDNIPPRLHVPYMDHILFNERNDGLARGEQFITASLNKKEKDRFFRNIYENSIAKFTSEERKKMIFERKGMGITTVLMKIISLSVINYDGRLYTQEENEVIKRMATVFEQTYTRFLDFQKAEANAREATIEASLERVRAKAMSMHSSKDLADTIGIFYQEMKLLSITPRRCGVCLMYKETHTVELSTMNTTEQGDSIDVVGKLRLTGHPVLESIYDNWILQKEYHPVLRGNEIKEYYKLIRTQMSYPDYPNDVVQYGYFFYFPEGSAYAWTVKELPEDDLQIYRRFTSVLSLTYKRYKDLQAAEANAKEAVKQAALDRIRADIASMRTTKDLDRITPLIWNELTILGVPFIRCGVFIMDNTEQLIHTFLSTPDGKAIAAFQLPFTTPGKISFVLENWRNSKNYIDHWDEKTFTEFADSLVQQGALQSVDDYMETLPAGGFCLHFLPFLQGMLYVGNTTQLNEEEINLVQSVANAFSTAYARYEDFNKLEAAKGQIENTLTNLKQAQTQLVQSEKMASLGELTAGIAHEIQNPLNFVNNFSEVSNELIEELKMKNEKLKIDDEEVNDLLNDIAQNLEKINHHGKRADAIVKGMLQHSIKSTGQKEPTDINALCDDYLRLSFHGLRAKDKSFNSEMKTDFDNAIGKIDVVPQDIGRVLLNLFNNAFYAVNEKKKMLDRNGSQTYVPQVTIVTKKLNDKVEIKVIDNGNGIPQNIVNKIFQPFFTTKPTGKGTGLGLSLAYDIIKAHGGEIKVESKVGEGGEFIIELPI